MSGGGVTEEIERCIAAISTLDPPSCADDLGDACIAITRLVNVALIRASSLLADFQQRGDWAEDGALSAATWVANRTGERRSELASRARVGSRSARSRLSPRPRLRVRSPSTTRAASPIAPGSIPSWLLATKPFSSGLHAPSMPTCSA
jgi:hypothetical protein